MRNIYEKEISWYTILDKFDFRELPRTQTTRKRSADENESHISEKRKRVSDSQSLVSACILN